MTFNTTFFRLSGSILLFFISHSLCDAQDSQTAFKNENQVKQSKIVASAIQRRDVQASLKEISLLEELLVNDDEYVVFLFYVCQSLYQIPDMEPSKKEFAEVCVHLTKKVLEKKTMRGTSLAKQWELAYMLAKFCVSDRPEKMKLTDLVKDKMPSTIEYLISVWKRISEKQDPTFNIMDHEDAFRPLSAISPKYQVSAMDPHCIDDEIERKKCLDYVAKQEELLLRQAEQKNAMLFEERFKKIFVQLLQGYSKDAPKNWNAVKSLLKKYDLDDITRQIEMQNKK